MYLEVLFQGTPVPWPSASPSNVNRSNTLGDRNSNSLKLLSDCDINPSNTLDDRRFTYSIVFSDSNTDRVNTLSD